MPEDRPDPEIVQNDKKFDSWLDDLSRKRQQMIYKAKSRSDGS